MMIHAYSEDYLNNLLPLQNSIEFKTNMSANAEIS